MRMMRLLLLIALAANTTACANIYAELSRDRRDAAWDPKPGQALHDQIPAWDSAATRVCGGHLTEEERRRTGRSPRC